MATKKKPKRPEHDLSVVDRKALERKIELDAPLNRKEIAVALGKSMAWVYVATTNGTLRMNSRIGLMTMSQIRADLARGTHRRAS